MDSHAHLQVRREAYEHIPEGCNINGWFWLTNVFITVGWLAWERFRCNIDCKNFPETCISENLFLQQAHRMAEDGWRVNALVEYISTLFFDTFLVNQKSNYSSNTELESVDMLEFTLKAFCYRNSAISTSTSMTAGWPRRAMRKGVCRPIPNDFLTESSGSPSKSTRWDWNWESTKISEISHVKDILAR